MALKDWTKVKTNKFQGTVSFTKIGRKKTNNVTLNFNKGNFKQWEATYGFVGSPKFKEFKTKAQALKFARDYMRKH